MPGPERFAALTGYRYYDVLGVPKQATRSEIRKAYHALALEYHPDRNVIDAQQSNETEWKEAAHKEAMFKSIQEAYSILTDDTKRRMYDQVGDQGIELLMNGGVGEALVNPVLLVLLSALLWILTVLILIFQVLLILRIDQPLRAVRHPRIWSWPVVFTPVWIIDFVPLIFATTLVITQVRDFDWKSLPIVLALFCVTASPITLVLVLVNVFPPVYAFIPLLPALFILIIRKLVSSLRRSEYESMCEASGDGGQAIEYVVYCLYELLSAGLWAAFAVMLTLKLILLDPRQPLAQTGRVHAYTFLVALSPLIAQQVVARLYYLRRTLRCQYIQKMNREGDRLIGPEGARQPSAFAVLCTREGIFHSVFSLICMLFPVSFLVLLGLYLDGFPGVQRFSLVCIPLIIGVGIMNLVSCLLCSALCCSLSSTLRYSSEAGGNYGADDDNVPIFHAK